MHAGPPLAGRVAEIIARAFATLPATRWLVPEPDKRQQVIRDQYRIWVDHAVQLGHAGIWKREKQVQ